MHHLPITESVTSLPSSPQKLVKLNYTSLHQSNNTNNVEMLKSFFKKNILYHKFYQYFSSHSSTNHYVLLVK